MTTLSETTSVSLRDEAQRHGLIVATAVEGVYLRSRAYERVVRGLEDMVSAAAATEEPLAFWAPPIIPRQLLEKTDYLRSFPNLAGAISSYHGGEAGYAALLADADAGREWAGHFGVTDLALCPAACHSLYPLLAGQVLDGERYFEIVGQCFRHEPSSDPARMQAFRMHEAVYIGTPDAAWDWRAMWLGRAQELLGSLDLEVTAVLANDPFFGRSGRMLASNQQSEALKIELVAPISSEESPTAITSANCHRDHFGVAFGIESSEGSTAHSACVGFGLDRIVLALAHRHGCDVTAWPLAVRGALGL